LNSKMKPIENEQKNDDRKTSYEDPD
jgi:hypothetical protein